MIAYLRGIIHEVDTNTLIVDVSGVGYEVQASKNTIEDMVPGAESALWIHTHVREDAMLLFGFSSKVEKHLFESLIKVNGIGPKLAVQVLSGATLDHIINLIENQDAKGLCQLPKVGKKTAEQMILTLRGKLVVEPSQKKTGKTSELQSALTHLGFKSTDVDSMIVAIDSNLEFEDQLRQALSLLGGK
jgi:holliday junction DNA helicase RuvA